MDTHVKEGQLYVQHQKFGKKWKKNWFVLYPASQNGIARLEFYDCSSGGGAGLGGGGGEKTRKLDKKIIRLSECISILPAVMESCPKDNMEAFCVETNEKTYVFAAERSLSHQWVDKMCEIAFQGGGGSGGVPSYSVSDSNGQKKELQMAENQIYFSREEVNEFWVSVQRTEASERCCLLGSYWLKADSDTLTLKEAKTKRPVLVWPYKLLRRYGRDRVMFSFEAGRRCDSGPGNFTFETKQGNEIFSLVERAIHSQKAMAEERHLSCPVNFDPDCPPSLQQLRSGGAGVVPAGGAGSGSDSRDGDGDSSGGSKPGSADGVFGKREGGDGGGGGGGGGGGRERAGRGTQRTDLPEPPGMSPSSSGPECLYSDPVDSIMTHSHNPNHSPPIPTPRSRPVGDDGGRSHGNQAEVLYSDLYDRVTVDLISRTSALGLDAAPGRGAGCHGDKRPPGGQAEGSPSPPWNPAEHIYDEPEGFGAGPPSEGKDGRKQKQPPPPPPPAYAQPQPGRLGGNAPGAPRWPKPLTAPKPSKGALPRREPAPLPLGKPGLPNVNVNNNNSKGGGGKELYSTVSRHKAPPPKWYPHPHPPPLQTPDIIYDNLGDI
ncbi:LOW QUALITY PROTEIN: docking protein 1b [Aplochiton taeniatus]